MTTATAASPGRPSGQSVEATLLAQLGLPANASSQQVESAHDALIGFLETAPADLAPWAGRHAAAIDEAYALLADPTLDRSGRVASTSETVADDRTPRTSDQGKPGYATPADRPHGRHRTSGSPASAPSAVGRGRVGPVGGRRLRRAAIAGVALVGVVAVALVGYGMGAPSVPSVAGSPQVGSESDTSIDTARVTELMQKIAADPRDVTSLQAVADIYFLANDFETAGGFLEKILEVDPQDVTARLALGASLFNVGKPTEAETQWRQVLAIDPDNLEAYYDLGFMYLSRQPADVAQARAAWQRVVDIAPDSEVARSIEQHLATLDASPAQDPATSAAPAAAPTNAAPSAAPTNDAPSAAPSQGGQ